MKVNQLKAGVALSYLNMFFSILISLSYTPIMLSILGQSEYGLYQLVASVVSYLSLFTFGFSGAYIRFYSRFKSNNDEFGVAKLNGMFLTAYSFVAVISFVCGILLALNVDIIFKNSLTFQEIQTARILMMILVVNISLSFPFSIFNSYISANQQFVFQKVLTLIKTIANPFLMLPILLLGYGSVGMVVVTTTLNILIEVTYAVYCMKKLNMKFYFKQFDFMLLKELTVFSSFIFINIIIDQVNWSVDKFILGMIHGTTTVAIYSLGAQLKTYYLQFTNAISNVFVPRVHQLVASGNGNDELTKLFAKVGRVQFIIVGLIVTGVIFFGQPFIFYWAGEEYAQSYYVALWLMIPLTVPAIQALGIEIQRAKNLHQFRSKVYLLIAVLNVIITIPLATRFGAIGSAMGTAFALISGSGIIMNIYYHLKIELDIIYFWKQILKFIPALTVPVAATIVAFQFVGVNSIFDLMCGIIIYTGVYCLSMWLWGMNSFEKSLIKNIMSKFLQKTKIS